MEVIYICGIHGVITTNTTYSAPLCAFVRQAFVANSLRGMDSSGVFQIGTTKKSVYLHKDAVNGSDFIQQEKTETILRDADSSLFTVCHVRAKTQGAVNAENAHPFVGFRDEMRVLGVHNGSLNNWKSNANAKDFEVDSAWAIQQIAETGHAAFSKFYGAYCMVWWDEEEPRKINFCRNNERPMHFLFSKDGRSMLYASEAGMLAWLAERVKFESDGRVREMPVGKIITFDTAGSKLTWDTTDAPRPVYTPAATTTYSGNRNSTYVSNQDENHRPIQYETDLRKWKAHLNGETSEPVTSMHTNVRPLCEVGKSCDAPFPDEFDDEDGYIPFDYSSRGTGPKSFSYAFEGQFQFPEGLIPPRRHLEATDREIENAKTIGCFGALAQVEWDIYISSSKQVMGSTTDEVTGVTYDVVMNDVSQNDHKRMLNNDHADNCCVIGVEDDGTLVVHRTTKRMRAFLSA